MLATFGLDLPPQTRLDMYFFDGADGVRCLRQPSPTTCPSCFPPACAERAPGFCYNIGRIITAVGPFLVGTVAARGADALGAALKVLTAVAIVPAVGSLLALFAPFVVETKNRAAE